MARSNTTKVNAASSITYDAAKQIVADENARRRQVAMQQLQAKAADIIASPTTQKVGLAVGGAALGAGIYALLTSA